MSEISSLPPGCVLRPARFGEEWLLQKLLLQFTQAEALAFDLRVLGFNLLTLVFLGLLLGLTIKLWNFLRFFTFLNWILKLLITFFSISLTLFIVYIILFLLSIFTYAVLNWSRFWVIECNGCLVACGEIHNYTTHSMLYYLFVKPLWRGQSMGSCLVKRLIQEATQPLYLVCKSELVRFYARLGFVVVPWQELPQLIKSSVNIFELDNKLAGNRWIIMQYRN